MENREAELLKFKTDINLAEFAISYGFSIDFEKCTKANIQREKNIVLKNGRDTILVSRDHTWKFWDTSRDKLTHKDVGGDIISFVQWQRPGLNIGEVRKELRSHSSALPPTPTKQQNKTQTPEKNIEAVRTFISQRKPAQASPYIEGRGISKETINHGLFKNKILVGFNGAVIFPHHDASGLCGYEYRGPDIRGFSKDGIKGLWYSQIPSQLDKIIFTESSIEALSHYQLNKPENVAYFSAGGNWTPETGQLIQRVMKKYSDAKIVAAFNHDNGGLIQTNKLELLAKEIGSVVIREMPKIKGQDWNQALVESLPINDDLVKKKSLTIKM